MSNSNSKPNSLVSAKPDTEAITNALQATPKVSEDICSAFDIEKDGIFRTTTYRSNLRLLAQSFKTGKEKEPELKKFLRQNQGPSIVYVQTHEQTETVCQCLKKDRFNAHGYHAGMSNDDRTAVQDKFMSSDNIIVRGLRLGLLKADDADNWLHRLWPQLLLVWELTRLTFEILYTMLFPRV